MVLERLEHYSKHLGSCEHKAIGAHLQEHCIILITHSPHTDPRTKRRMCGLSGR